MTTNLHRIERAARELVEKLDQIHTDPTYESVWVIYQTHQGPYDGPGYKQELEALRRLLGMPEKG